MNLEIKTSLYDKEVIISGKKVPIFGISHFRVRPRRIGLGRLGLELIKKFCKEKGKPIIAGFVADDNILTFYVKCGWFECGEFNGLKAVCSEPLQITFTEFW